MEALLVANLPTIEALVGRLARRYGLQDDERKDVLGRVRLKLMENDYARLRKFDGRSTLRKYLAAVVSRLFLDYRNEKWGRWRPSAQARRAGELGLLLERLLDRDGYGMDAAIRLLRQRLDCELSDRELYELAASFPERGRPRVEPVGENVEGIPGEADTEERLWVAEARRRAWKVMDALAQAMEDLPTEDRLILKARFWEGLTVADVARSLGLEQRPLYRRLPRLLEQLRERLVSMGVAPEEIRMLLDWRES